MLASFLMGLVGGQRSMTPLAAVAVAAARDGLPPGCAAPAFLRDPAVATGAVALALAEMAGDKMKGAPDRIVLPGLAARFLMTGLAAGALAPRGRFWHGAALGGLTAAAASCPGWRARMAAMEDHGQIPTGLAEDAIVLAGAVAILGALRPGRDRAGRDPPAP